MPGFSTGSQITRPLAGDRTAPSDPQRLLWLRHTCAHVLAMAVQRLFPETRVIMGPPIDTGFYDDFDRAIAFTPDDITRIHKHPLNYNRQTSSGRWAWALLAGVCLKH